MKRLNRREVLKTASVLGVTAIGAGSTVAATNAGEEPGKVDAGTFTGRVDELSVDLFTKPDRKSTWSQVILSKGEERLVAVTNEARLQSLLELAFATGKDAEVSYYKDVGTEHQVKILTLVKVVRGAGGK